MVNTKDIPAESITQVQVGGNWNTTSVFHDFTHAKGSATDFLGFDNGMRSLNGGFNASLHPIGNGGTDLTGNGLNNDWTTKSMKPFGDLKLSANIGRRWKLGRNQLGMIAALNYTNEYRTFSDMQNNQFGVYDERNDRSIYLSNSLDNQYNHNARLGAMLNLTLLTAGGNSKFQMKTSSTSWATTATRSDRAWTNRTTTLARRNITTVAALHTTDSSRASIR